MTPSIEKIIKEFIGKFCNDHNERVRFLRGVFYDEQDGAEEIIDFLRSALLQIQKETREEAIAALGDEIELEVDSVSFPSGEIKTAAWKRGWNDARNAFIQVLKSLNQ